MIIKHTNEDFDYHYNLQSLIWKDKIVLDLGADCGSTAYCFLKKGATKIYAVEGDKELFIQLAKYSTTDKNLGKIFCSMKFIDNSNILIELINDTQYDICKMDIEGYEKHILDVPENIIKKIKEYVIETHYNKDRDKIIDKFINIGYNLKDTIHLDSPEVYVLYFILKDK